MRQDERSSKRWRGDLAFWKLRFGKEKCVRDRRKWKRHACVASQQYNVKQRLTGDGDGDGYEDDNVGLAVE